MSSSGYFLFWPLTGLASGEWERATYGDRKWLAADGGRGASHVERRTGFNVG